jgi:putative cardiolipin synthase
LLSPGSDFPETASTALPYPEQTRLGCQFESSARDHAGTSAFRLLSAGVDGFLARAEMINTAERTLDLEYFIFRQDETGQLLTDALLRVPTAASGCACCTANGCELRIDRGSGKQLRTGAASG